jgi:hypothetical protein
MLKAYAVGAKAVCAFDSGPLPRRDNGGGDIDRVSHLLMPDEVGLVWLLTRHGPSP